MWKYALAILLLMAGCVSSDGGEPAPVGQAMAEVVNEPPVADIVLESNEGRVPFYPSFTYYCYDPEDRLKYCSLSIDGKEVYRWGPFPSNVDWPENLTMEYIREPGTHTIELVAEDAEGQTARDVEEVNIRKEIYAYVERLPTGIDERYYSSLDEAFKYWEDKLGVEFIKVKEGEDIYIDWAKEYAGETIGRAEIGGKRMIIGLGDSYCFEKYRPYKPSSVRNIAIHELGHILGYEHVNNTSDYMNPIIPNISYEVEIDEEVLVPSGYYWYFQPCSPSGTFDIEVSSEKPIDVYQIASQEDYENALRGKSFRYRSDCFGRSTTSFKRECSFEEGNLLMLSYDGRDATSVRVVMKRVD